MKGTFSIGNQLNSENTDSHHLVDTFSGKVFISVADAGETAVVVSTIGGKHVVEDDIVNEDSSNHHEVEQFMLRVDSCSHELGSPLDQKIKAGQSEPPVPSENLCGANVESEPIEDDCRIGLGLGLSLSANGSGNCYCHIYTNSFFRVDLCLVHLPYAVVVYYVDCI